MRNNTVGRWIMRAGCACVLLMQTSCVTGPDYNRPDVNSPAGYKSAVADESATPGLSQDWWWLFEDPELTSLMEEALGANLDLKAAMARVEQSRAAARSVKGSFYPVISLDPSAGRSRTPVTETETTTADKLSQISSAITQVSGILNQLQGGAEDGSSGSQSGSFSASGLSAGSSDATGVTSNRFQIPFDLSYEIDMWGRIRRSYESASAQVQASEYDFEVVRQTLLADLARNYFNLRLYDAQYEILTRNLGLYQEQVDLTQSQYQSGLISETNLLQAKVQLESTRAQAVDTQRQRTNLEHAMAILLGRTPADFSIAPKTLNTVPPVIPAGLPSDLLRCRPDVAEAEQNLVAACAEIGVAKAEFFPTVKLTGSAGFQSSDIDDVLDWHNRTWSIGPSISLPIFKGGQLKANLEKAKARYEELNASYRKTVLSAYVDVEDSLTDLHMRADASDAQTKAVEAAREYLRLTQIEYQVGVTDYLHVVNAEQTLLSNELSEVQIQHQRMISTVLLIKAIGSGWEAKPLPSQNEAR